MNSYWQESLFLRGKKYPRFIGGPLDGYTDTPFRMLVRKFSPDHILYSTIRHVACIAHKQGAERALKLDPHDHPLIFQITANSPDYLLQAVELILQKNPVAIDLNIACPARNVIKSKSGSALMADIPILTTIVKILRQNIPIAFTVKMRAGFKEPNALNIAQLLCDLGVDALAIHPRLQSQKFAGIPNLTVVHDIKKHVCIPVLYSGGIHTIQDAHTIYEQTGVDGFLIGRALLGQPWKLAQLTAQSHSQPYEISHTLAINIALEHLHCMCQFYGDKGLYAFRKHASHYVHDLPKSTYLRTQLFNAQSIENMRTILQGALLSEK